MLPKFEWCERVECYVAALSPNSSRDPGGAQEARNEHATMIIDNLFGVVAATSNVDFIVGYLRCSGRKTKP